MTLTTAILPSLGSRKSRPDHSLVIKEAADIGVELTVTRENSGGGLTRLETLVGIVERGLGRLKNLTNFLIGGGQTGVDPVLGVVGVILTSVEQVNSKLTQL